MKEARLFQLPDAKFVNKIIEKKGTNRAVYIKKYMNMKKKIMLTNYLPQENREP